MRKGVSSNENANDITVHNDAILLTAVSPELRLLRGPNGRNSGAVFPSMIVIVGGGTMHSKGLIALAIADWIAIVIGDYFSANQSKAVTD